MKRRRPTGRPLRRRSAALLLSLALSSTVLPRPTHAKKWKYDADQCGLLLTAASSADADGSGGLDTSEADFFRSDLLAKSAATEADGGAEDWWFEESVCACRYTYRLDWACCDDTASFDDLKPKGEGGEEGLVFPFGEIPLPDHVVLANPGKDDWATKRVNFERKFCKEMFKIVEKNGGSYDLDMSLGAAEATTTEATTTPAATTTEATTTPAATTTEATTTSTTEAPLSTTEAATTSEPSTTTPETPPVDDPSSELDQLSLSSINDASDSGVLTTAGSEVGGDVPAGAFVGAALATLLVLLLASALIARRRRRTLREDEDAVGHEALNDSAEEFGEGERVGAENWYDERSDAGGTGAAEGSEQWHDEGSDVGGGGDGARTSTAAGSLAAMGVASTVATRLSSTVATRLTTGESEVMLTDRPAWSRVEPDV